MFLQSSVLLKHDGGLHAFSPPFLLPTVINTSTAYTMFEFARPPKRSTNRLLLHRAVHLNMLLFKAGLHFFHSASGYSFRITQNTVGGPVNLVNNLAIWAAA